MNRALILAALASGESRITKSVKADDTNFMAAGLKQLGVKIREPSPTEFLVTGCQGKFQVPKKPLFLGNAGTAVRFLTGVSLLVPGQVIIDGNAKMCNRPIQDLVDALQNLNCQIKFLKKTGCPPLLIQGGGPKFSQKIITISGKVSSQFISALAFVLPFCQDKINLQVTDKFVSQPYFDLTLDLQKKFGAKIKQIAKQTWEFRQAPYQATDLQIEPDASSATYFWAAAALTDQKIKLSNFPPKSRQPDLAVKNLLKKFPQNFGLVSAQKFPDAIPTLAVVAAFAQGATHFTDLQNLRVKECDRVAALAKNLNNLKPGLAKATQTTLTVFGDPQLKPRQPIPIQTFADHRIAMSFALINLRGGRIILDDPKCVSKSFPDFWPELSKVKQTAEQS